MLSPHIIQPYSCERKQKISNQEHDFGKSQLTSNDLKRPQMTSDENEKSLSKKVRSENNLGAGDPNDNSTNGRDLIEQAFSSILTGEFIEIKKRF